MASSQRATGSIIMRSLLLLQRGRFIASGSISTSTSTSTSTRCSSTCTSGSIRAYSNYRRCTNPSSIITNPWQIQVQNLNLNLNLNQNENQCQRIIRRSMAYASVNHQVEYKHQMEGRHGEQLRLAYEEGRKYEHDVVDPFELYKIEEEELELEEDGDGDGDGEDEDGEEEEEYDHGYNDDTEYEYEHEHENENEYETDGQLKRSRAELVSLRAGAPAGGKFAVINLYGSQHKVTVDDVVIVNKLKPVSEWSVGSVHTLRANSNANDDSSASASTSDSTSANGNGNANDDHEAQVLLMGSQEKTLVGLPSVDGGEVDVMVEEITRDKKVIIFKKKRRKNYRRKNGFKREVTFLRVLDIRFP